MRLDANAPVALVVDRLAPVAIAPPNGAPERRARTTLRASAEVAPNGISVLTAGHCPASGNGRHAAGFSAVGYRIRRCFTLDGPRVTRKVRDTADRRGAPVFGSRSMTLLAGGCSFNACRTGGVEREPVVTPFLYGSRCPPRKEATLSTEFCSPEKRIAAATLATITRQLELIGARLLLAQARIGPPTGWLDRLDPATRRCLDDYIIGWPDGPPDDDATDPSREAEKVVAERAVSAGYWYGRRLLGTDARLLRWSDHAGTDAERLLHTVEEIDISCLEPRGGIGVDLVDELAGSAGYPAHEALVSMGLMAFDGALALALLEHDRAQLAAGN